MVRWMRTAGILAALVLSIVAVHGQARADTARAWAAAKAGLPADTKVVIGVDIAAVQKTQLFATFYPKLNDQSELMKVLNAVQVRCQINPLAVIQGVVLALVDREDGVMYVALSGIDRGKLAACLQSIAQDDARDAAAEDAVKHGIPSESGLIRARPPRVTVKQTGNITEVGRADGGGQSGYFGWVGSNVLVVTLHATDKAMLARWMAGKGALAASDIGKNLARVNTQAAVWGAAADTRELQPGTTAKATYGAVTYAKGQLSADIHAVMEDAAQAGSASMKANQQLNLAKAAGQVPAEIAPVIQAITISADHAEVRIKTSVPEKDVLGVISFAMNNLGSS